jgi:two-component system chemotaxis response regulator CheB
MPVVMVSTLTEAGADVTLQALDLGAIDFITKPRNDVRRGLEDYSQVLIEKIKTAARARVWARGTTQQAPAPAVPRINHAAGSIIAIGASTGGTEAIKAVVLEFPADAPPTVVTQHIPANFSQPFVDRLDRLSAVTVKHAEDGEKLMPGTVYFPPGEHHLRLVRSGARYVCKLDPGPPVNRHRPSVDVLFHSVAEAAGKHTAAVILTGMGGDGAQGLLAIRQAGGVTFAQDEASSVVWGMPRVAVELGAAQKVLPLKDVAYALLTAHGSTEGRARAVT